MIMHSDNWEQTTCILCDDKRKTCQNVIRYIYLNINELGALNFIMSLFYASTRFERHVLIVRRSKLYYTASGLITLIGGRPVHRLREENLVHQFG